MMSSLRIKIKKIEETGEILDEDLNEYDKKIKQQK